MKTWLVVLACALSVSPLRAGLLDRPERLPAGSDAVFAIDLSAGAIPRAAAALSFSAKASEQVITEQLTGFAADTGIDLTGPFTLVVAGPRAHPEQVLASGSLKVDTAKLLSVLKPMAANLPKMEIKEVGGGLLLLDRTTGLYLKDGSFVIGQRANVEALVAGGAAAPDTKAIAAELTERAGVNPACALLIRTPQGLPGQPPPPAAVGGQQLAGFWTRFRAGFAAVRERDFALQLVFDSPDAAGAALPVVNGWLDIVESQLAAAVGRAKTAAAESGPFKHLNGGWIGARLSLENFKTMRASCAVKTEGPALVFSVPRELFGAQSALMSTAIVGVLAAIAVPNFKAARDRANVRACYANQRVIAGALEMFKLDKNQVRKEITPAVLEELVKEKYLMSTPSDPGQGEGTAANYYAIEGSNGVACRVHGSIDGSVKGTAPAMPAPPANAIEALFGR